MVEKEKTRVRNPAYRERRAMKNPRELRRRELQAAYKPGDVSRGTTREELRNFIVQMRYGTYL